MVEPQTIIRTTIAIGENVFPLAQGANVDELVMQIEEAVRAGGTFVNFIVVGNRRVRVLITEHSQVSITTEPVQLDRRDTGDPDFPFGAHFDDYS